MFVSVFVYDVGVSSDAGFPVTPCAGSDLPQTSTLLRNHGYNPSPVGAMLNFFTLHYKKKNNAEGRNSDE